MRYGLPLKNKSSLVLLSHSKNNSEILKKWDTASQGKQGLETTITTFSSIETPPVVRNLPALVEQSPDTCSVPCLNGGECTYLDQCNCSQFNAQGSRCQTVPNTGYERDMICRTWGQYNFETFDGLYFNFPGTCMYTLVKDCDQSEPTFLVQAFPGPGDVHFKICALAMPSHLAVVDDLFYIQAFEGLFTYWQMVHNDPQCHFSSSSCQRSVSLFFSSAEEIRLKGSQVTCNGMSITLPYTSRKIRVERIAEHVLVTHHHIFILAWDGNSGVYIKMNPEYIGKTCGLCGNFTGDLQDDLLTSSGLLTEDIATFANSWMEPYPNESCTYVPTNYPSPCSTQSQETLKVIYTLCNRLLESPFIKCQYHVSPYPFLASCTNDLCMSGPEDVILCRALNEYARACAQAGYPLHGWRRKIPQCAVGCEGELIYRECISCCPSLCHHHMKQCFDSELQCLDGCYCPEELIYENGTCIKPSECPCMFHGISYATGSVVQEECNNCTCMGGIWNCTDNICPAECSVTGDIHFMTFDGKPYTFQATCQYILAKSRSSGKFTVILQNTACRGNLDGSCIQSVSVVIDQDPKKQVTLTHTGEVFVCNQYKVNLPYIDGLFEIRQLSSLFVQVKTKFGLQIQYDKGGLRLYLVVDGQWKDDTVGLCGTFNGNIQDDFLSPAGVPESIPEIFANSWKISSACGSSKIIPLPDPCDIHLQAAPYASESCSVLTKDIFAPCHQYLSPISFHEQCKSDTCKCGQICMCAALAHYARQCRKHGVIIDFRRNVTDCELSALVSLWEKFTHLELQAFQLQAYGTSCPNSQTYFNCSDSMENDEMSRGIAYEKTCENQLLNMTFSGEVPCISGCICPPGFMKHGDECFKPDNCPCFWKGKEYFPEDKVTSPCYTCICQQGSFQCTFQPCPSTCTAYGDRHYMTFDGLLFDFIGACKVYLVKSNSDPGLSVIAENMNCYNTGIICRKFLQINVGRSFLVFDDDTGIPNPSSLIDKQQNVQIWQAGFFTIVNFPNENVTILWDRRTTVHIQVGPNWKGELLGLCGNFDLKTTNEMRTPDNIETGNSQEFGNSWSAVECVNSPDIQNPCNLSPLREPYAKKKCGILLSEVFEACHPVVDVTWFHSNCLTDTCGCTRGGDCECLCTSVSAYAHRCCQHGITVDWRSPTTCPFDCEYFNKFLGKGPYKLAAYLDGKAFMAANLSGGIVFPVKGDVSIPGISFMLTPGLYKPKAYDTSLISFEAAERPNFFLLLGSNGSLFLSKWEENEEFQTSSTFILHKDTWITGYSSFESFKKPGFFIHYMISSVHLMKHEHTEGFRQSSHFRLIESNFRAPARSTCEWRYDSCATPCFKTCRDPTGENCETLPKIEGCFPKCPSYMVLDEVTMRCVYFEDCIKPAVVVLPSPLSITTIPPEPAWNLSVPVLSSTHFVSATTIPSSASTFTTVLKLNTTTPHEVSTVSISEKTLATSPVKVTAYSVNITAAILPTTSPYLSKTTPSITESMLSPSVATTAPKEPDTTAKTSAKATSREFIKTSIPYKTGITEVSSTVPSLVTTSVTDLSQVTSSKMAITAAATTVLFKRVTSSAIPETITTPETGSRIFPTKEVPLTTQKTTQKPYVITASNYTVPTSVQEKNLSATTYPSTTHIPLQSTQLTSSVVYPILTEMTSSSLTMSQEQTKSLETSTTKYLSPIANATEITLTPFTWKSTPLNVTVYSSVMTTQPSTASSYPTTKLKTTLTPIITSESTVRTESVTEKTEYSMKTVKTSPAETFSTEFVKTISASKEYPRTVPYPTPEQTISLKITPIGDTTSTETQSATTRSHYTMEKLLETSAVSLKTLPGAWSTKETSTVFYPETSSIKKTLTTTAYQTLPETSSITVTYPVAKFSTIRSTAKLTTTYPLSVGSTTLSVYNVTFSTRSPTEITAVSFTSATTETLTSYPHTSKEHTTVLLSTGQTRFKETSPPTITPLLISPITKTTTPKTSTVISLSPELNVTAGVTSNETAATQTSVAKATISSTTSAVSLSPAIATYTTLSKATSEKVSTPSASLLTSAYSSTSYSPAITSSVSFTTSSPIVTTEKLSTTTKTFTSTVLSTTATSHVEAHVPETTKELPFSEFSTVTLAPSVPSSLLPTKYWTTVPKETSRNMTVPTTKNLTSISITQPVQVSTSTEVTLEAMTGATFMSTSSYIKNVTSQSTQTCTVPFPEYPDPCIEYFCVNGHLIKHNKTQTCPYNATAPTCGLMGLALEVNGDKCCPKWECPCQCTIYSDLRLMTFDGSNLGIFKAASYIITHVQQEIITIKTQNCQNLMGDYRNSIKLCLATLNITHPTLLFSIDRLKRKLFVNSTSVSSKYRKNGFMIMDTGHMYLIKTPAGIKIKWFHNTGMMTIETNTSSKLTTMGLCGYCDRNQTNDFTLLNGTVLSEGENPTTFMDSWQVPNTLRYVGEDRRRDVNCSTSDCSECFSMLYNQTFSSCHPFVSPEVFCEIWIQDEEYVKNPCIALAAYVATCQKFNICIKWRTSDYCSFHCPQDLRYQACLPVCNAKTCQNYDLEHLDVQECSGLSEGCVCPEGTVLHRSYSDLCIPEEKCACTDSFGTPRAPGETWTTSPDSCCTYTCIGNDTIIPVEHNCSDVIEPECRHGEEVVIILSDDKSCCPQKTCICNQTICESYIPQCSDEEKLILNYKADSCCPEYICVCAACSDNIPKCQDGEILIVDGNTTDRCCPGYQCVCETHRCPEYNCSLGKAIIEAWSPEQCCPYKTCVCACETIPKPNCKLGEAIQIDEEFQNDPENQCGCIKYKCVKNQVCVDEERGVLHPGQTIVEHTPNGFCHITHCTSQTDPQTNYYQISVKRINCTATCQSNQKYEPPVDLTTCCGICKNVTCLHTIENGTVKAYEPGTSWISNCVRYGCTDTMLGPVLTASPISCPPFNETECLKIGGTIVPFMDGCCKSCKEDAKFCQKVTVRMKIRKNDCKSNIPINIVSCDGKCPSASIYNYNINTYARFCKCCRETGLQTRTVQLFCSGNSTWVSYSIQEPTDCSCQWS
nr:PREDICTED: otogelin [Latimeria chalumnae]|eukprot:XP_014340755.1 PREDICTED: otogelin [Latimeria chalumnae]